MDGDENKPKQSRRKKKDRRKRIAKFYSIESLRLLYYRKVEVILSKIYIVEKEIVKKIMTFRAHKIFANVCVCAIILSAIALPFLRGEIIVAGDGGGNHEAVNPIDPTPIDPPTPPIPMPPPYFDDLAVQSSSYKSIAHYNETTNANLLNLDILSPVDKCNLYALIDNGEVGYIEEILEYIDMEVIAWDQITLYVIPSDKNFSFFKSYEDFSLTTTVKNTQASYEIRQLEDDMFAATYKAAFEYEGIRYFMDIKTSMPEDAGNRLEDYLNILIPDNN